MGDLVTQLQLEINALCSLFFSTIGALQRDAPSVPLDAEPLVAPPAAPYDTPHETKNMAGLIAQCSARIDELIKKLPEAAGGGAGSAEEAAQLEAIAKLQQLDGQLTRELREGVEAAEAKLRQLQDAFQVLAAATLAQRRDEALAQAAAAAAAQQQQQSAAAPGGRAAVAVSAAAGAPPPK